MTYCGSMQMAGIFSDFGEDCPKGKAYLAMVARIDELERTWNPTGFYKPDDMFDVLAAVVALGGQASSAATSFFAGNSSPRSKSEVRKAFDGYWAVAKRAIDYTEASRAAKAANKPIAAPGFKRWVIDDMRAAATLLRTLENAECFDSVVVSGVVSIAKACIAVADTAKRAGKTALAVAGGVVKMVERTGDIAAFLLKWTPYIALGVGGYIAYNKYARK